MGKGKRRERETGRDEPIPRQTEVELDIVTLTNMGQGLGRLDGWVIMVPFALPGERVLVKVWRNHANFSEADLVRVLEPSPHRVEPRCPLFTRCGGCQYQTLAYAEQLVWKRRQVEELLRHMAGLECEVQPVIGSPREWNYRSKITPHFQAPRNGTIGDIGFLRAGRRMELVDVPECAIATGAINERLASLRTETRANAGRYKKGATLLLRDTGTAVHTDPNAVAVERVANLEFEFLAGDFFQNNPFILESFAGYGVAEARRGGARFMVDAYCGSGLFALTAAAHFEQVAGVEIAATAVERATRNAARNGLTNCSFIAGHASQIFEGISFPAAETAVLIDPPRAGSDEEFLTQLFAWGPRTVVYVSCNPATQMRDLKLFLAAGWKVDRVQPFDLFPQTKHLECVVTLTRPGT